MQEKLEDRIEESVDVSGAFDNCFFHTYAAHLLANDLPLADDLFNFKSILGGDSPASQLQKRFPNSEALSVFAEYQKIHSPEEEPLSPEFMVEKTLVLGFLMREWFATQMAAHSGTKNALLGSVLTSFKNYKEFRGFGVPKEDLLSGAEGVVYKANEAFLEYFHARPKGGELTDEEERFEKYFTDAEENIDEALKAFWNAEGYDNYCRNIANPQTKLSYQEVMPVINLLGQPLTIYDRSGTLIHANDIENDTPKLEVTLDPLAGHYHLLKTEKTTPLLEEYEKSYTQYKVDREAVLSTVGDKDIVAETKPSLLVAAICPMGHLKVEPFDALRNKVDSMGHEVAEFKRLKLEEQRKLEEQPHRSPTEDEQRKLKEEQQHKLMESSKEIDELLKGFGQKISDIGKHSSDAQDAALELHEQLKTLKDAAFNEPTTEKLNKFRTDVQGAIEAKGPRLQKDISFWNAALNVVKSILNVITQIFSLGYSNGFFTPHKSQAVTDAEKLQTDINDAFKPK